MQTGLLVKMIYIAAITSGWYPPIGYENGVTTGLLMNRLW